MTQVGEASVEDILESIKKVMGRDNGLHSGEQYSRHEPHVVGAGHGGTMNAIPMGRPSTNTDHVLDLARAETWLPAADEADRHDEEEEPLITADVRTSMRESLAALAVLAEPRAQPQIVRSGETSLETLVRELLRPALTEWLEKHLPALVERLVTVEIARIVGKKG